MTRLDEEYRNHKNATIDYDHYRRLAVTLRREARTNLMKSAFSALAAFLRFPQKRWTGRRASSKLFRGAGDAQRRTSCAQPHALRSP